MGPSDDEFAGFATLANWLAVLADDIASVPGMAIPTEPDASREFGQGQIGAALALGGPYIE